MRDVLRTSNHPPGRMAPDRRGGETMRGCVQACSRLAGSTPALSPFFLARLASGHMRPQRIHRTFRIGSAGRRRGACGHRRKRAVSRPSSGQKGLQAETVLQPAPSGIRQLPRRNAGDGFAGCSGRWGRGGAPCAGERESCAHGERDQVSPVSTEPSPRGGWHAHTGGLLCVRHHGRGPRKRHWQGWWPAADRCVTSVPVRATSPG